MRDKEAWLVKSTKRILSLSTATPPLPLLRSNSTVSTTLATISHRLASEKSFHRGRGLVCLSCVSVQRQQAGKERWGAGVETQKNVRGEIGGWGRVPFNETYAPSLSTIYDGA